LKKINMLTRTHLAITVFFILLLFSSVDYKLEFIIVSVIATFIPDIDFRFSKIGNYKTSRILQLFVKHRGIMHSFTFLFIISLFLILFFPVIAFPFFLGYSLHLLADSFTIKGIKPFYPSKKNFSGKLKSGSRAEILVFVSFLITDLLLFFIVIFNM